jgi:outer membrane protein assembly factor BamB
MRAPKPRLGRRGLLLGASLPLLAGCETLEDWFGRPTPRLPGERSPILAEEAALTADEGLEPIALPPPEPRREWLQTLGSPAHIPGHPAAADRLAVAWTANVGTGASRRQRLISAPVIAGGRVFAMDALSRVSAFDLATGRNLWRADARPEEETTGGLGGGLAVEGELLVVVSGFAEVLGLSVNDGSIAWRRRLPAPARGAPGVAEGRAFVPTLEGQMLAVRLDSGEIAWTYRGSGGGAGLLGIPAPAIDAGTVIGAFPSGEVAALRPDTGRVLWVESLAATGGLAPLNELSSVRAAPIISQGRVIALAGGGLFVSLDLRSGRRVWEREVGGTENAWLAGDWLFAVTNEQLVAAFSRRDGRAKWVRQLQPFEDMQRRRDPIRWVGPTLAGDRLIVTNSRRDALALSPYTGEELGTQRLPNPAAMPAIVADGTVLFLTEDATLVALR